MSQVETAGGDDKAPELPAGVQLGSAGAALWQAAVESLPDVLRPIDFASLHLCCVSYDIASTAAMAGDTKLFFDAMGKFTTLSKTLGLNPNARGSIKKAADAKPESNPLDVWEKT